MGQSQSQSATASWSVDDWAFGTGANALSAEEVINETSKLPAKLFGGSAIENDPSMHQMQNDLLSVDSTLKNLFRGKNKKNKKSKSNQQYDYQQDQQYYHESQQGQPPQQQQQYLQPVPVDQQQRNPSAPMYPQLPSYQSNQRLTWRCTGCTTENKVTERYCRRCGQAETSL